ncbi:hypothetical protein PPERSA_11396 [Pseudocohnilembus persalinus]|uniref:Uncharacterized protein n=1 Tax=Pseudocohnilembus persalinus TaxID=266149 RepID=A0A0V0QQH0_PSEPJ|nr:hypothetical protein PPERSA_11396 [Pseudocohnilembus persalinus]|eukprot:KRX04272.1 hypothetical protein PPERSA_11396 [Pseudocohnilembus persalinus]
MHFFGFGIGLCGGGIMGILQSTEFVLKKLESLGPDYSLGRAAVNEIEDFRMDRKKNQKNIQFSEQNQYGKMRSYTPQNYSNEYQQQLQKTRSQSINYQQQTTQLQKPGISVVKDINDQTKQLHVHFSDKKDIQNFELGSAINDFKNHNKNQVHQSQQSQQNISQQQQQYYQQPVIQMQNQKYEDSQKLNQNQAANQTNINHSDRYKENIQQYQQIKQQIEQLSKKSHNQLQSLQNYEKKSLDTQNQQQENQIQNFQSNDLNKPIGHIMLKNQGIQQGRKPQILNEPRQNHHIDSINDNRPLTPNTILNKTKISINTTFTKQKPTIQSPQFQKEETQNYNQISQNYQNSNLYTNNMPNQDYQTKNQNDIKSTVQQIQKEQSLKQYYKDPSFGTLQTHQHENLFEQNQKLKDQVQNLQIQNSNMTKEQKYLEQQLIDLEGKMKIVLEENTQLNIEIRHLQKNQDSDTILSLKQKIQDYEQQIDDKDQEIEDLKIQLSQNLQKSVQKDRNENQIKVVIKENERLLKILDDKDHEIKQYYDLENKVTLLLHENESLNTNLEKTLNDYHNLDRKYKDQGNFYSSSKKNGLQEDQNLQQMVDMLQKENDELKNNGNFIPYDQFKKFDEKCQLVMQENDSLQIKISEKNQLIQKLEDKIKTGKSEIEEYKYILNDLESKVGLLVEDQFLIQQISQQSFLKTPIFV